LCVYQGEEVTFAKKAVKRSKSYLAKSTKPIADDKPQSAISFETISSDQENFEIFENYTDDIDFMDTIIKPHAPVSQKMGSSGDGGSMANY